MVHEDYKELLSAKALSALAADDARALDSHLEGCAECRAELIEWEQTAAFLTLGAKPLEPSPELREKILKNLGGVRADKPKRAELPVPPAESNVLPFERQPRNESSWGRIGAIAAAIALVALLASVFGLWQQNRRAQSELARVSAQMDAANAQLARQREALALLTSPGARMASLSGTTEAPTAQAMLAYDKKGHAMLMAKGLPAVPDGMAYQLWFIKDGKKMPGRVFIPDSAGNGMLEDEVPDVARDAAVFAITLEPKSGVQVPTGSIYLVSAI